MTTTPIKPAYLDQLLPGWENSKGATLEHHIAERLGLHILMPLTEIEP